jgi:hypothetical protein
VVVTKAAVFSAGFILDPTRCSGKTVYYRIDQRTAAIAHERTLRGAKDLGTIRQMSISPPVFRPFVPPTSPSRLVERAMAAFSIISFGAFVALWVYVAFPLDLPRALPAFLPMLIMPLGLAWAWKDAKKKRLAAEAEVERYRAGLRLSFAKE